ncbi:MAG TPA: HU family DNA-binding protein [Longimicrobiales bacterium]
MNKGQVIDRLADRAKLSKKDARAAVDALFDPANGVIARALKGGDRVSITGFGTFEVRQRGERMGRNPRTGETMRVPPSKAPAFRAGKGLKEGVGRR